MKKRDYLNIILLVSIFLLIILIITRNNYLYGSTTDWLSQHVTIAEYFRNLFYDTHQLIPNFAFNLSGGVNIFNMSYYGLLNPIILFSYLLPNVSMIDYIQLSSILIVIFSIILFYIFSKRHLDSNLSFLTTLIFMCASPIIFHSHRHIMFINYMPFMIMALIGVERYFNKNKSDLLILSIFLIIMTSYFYSVSSIIGITIYAIYYYLKVSKFNIKEFINTGLKYALRVIIGICMACVILLPTLYVVSNGRLDTNFTTLISSLFLDINLKLVLYGSYSMGLTSIFIVAIIYNLLGKKREKIFLSLVFLSFIIFPFVNYLLNGFMYIDGKALIPFVPVASLFIGESLNEIFKTKFNKKSLIITTILFSIVSFIVKHNYLFIIDVSLIIIGIIFIKKKYILTFVLISILIIRVITINLNDELLKKDVKNDVYDKSIYENISYNGYRVASLNNLNGINKINNIREYRISNYSSILNKYYWEFYFKTFDNENPHRNFLMFGKNQNVLFNMYMGNKYLVGKKDMLGYEKIGNNLYRSDYVLPISYASSNLMSLKDFKTLAYPDNIEALLKYIIVDKDVSNSYTSNFDEDIDYEVISKDNLNVKKQKEKYFIKSNKGHIKLKYDKKYDNQIIVIKFEVEDKKCDKNNKGDISITINGIRNVLTCSDWKYYNGNNTFTYVLSDEFLDVVFSSNDFVIKNIKNYVVDFNNIKNINNNVDNLNIDVNKTKGDLIIGNIDVKEDGYFIVTIPYDKGFKIYVDGKLTDYELVDTAFMGFPILKGPHQIKIVYKSPYLKEGKIITLIGFISFVIVLCYERCRR